MQSLLALSMASSTQQPELAGFNCTTSLFSDAWAISNRRKTVTMSRQVSYKVHPVSGLKAAVLLGKLHAGML